NSRRAALLFLAWTLVGLVFAAVSYGVALSQNDKRFGIAASPKLNCVLFSLWGVSSPLILRFCRRFRIEFRRLSIRNLTVHVPAIVLFAAVHETLFLAILWSITPSVRGELATITDYCARHF